MIAQANGVFQRFDLVSIFGRPGYAVIIIGAASRQHQVIVRVSIFLGFDQAGVQVDFFDLVQQEAHALVMKDAAHRVGDILRFKLGGGDLVKQGRKSMVVVSVEHDNISRGARQPARRPKASETGADNDHTRFSFR